MSRPQRRYSVDINPDVYVSDINPQKLTFIADIVSTNQIVGGTLKIPGYYKPVDMVVTADLVSVDDPEWLVLAAASELARNDSAKQEQFPNLTGMANDLYDKMIIANDVVGFGNEGTVPNLMPQVSPPADTDGLGG